MTNKNFFTLFLFIIVLLTSVHTNSQGFNSIFSKNGSDVIAVGAGGSIFRSWTGGTSWGTYPLGSADLNSFQALGTYIWIVGNNGTYYYSSNDGVNWNSQTLAGGQNLKSVSFFDQNTGLITGDNGTILKTINSGANWTVQISPVSAGFKSVKFISSTEAVACGTAGNVIYTTNGGTNWLQYTTPTTKDLL